MRAGAGLVTAVAIATALAGCASAPISTSSTPAPAPAGVRVLGDDQAPAEGLDELQPADATPQAVPTPGADHDAGALAQALTTLRAWADSALPADRWRAQLAPLMSAPGLAALAGTDPAAVPVHKVNGGRVVDAGTAYLAWVAADTDAGTWWVLVSWQPATGQWLTERITRSGGPVRR
ncbi:MAG: hypothetical protein BGO26_00180 [Actinobacteria bacterium 69-20]|jgi:hypothetical protein|nr:MAG: hypothetical protein BGO26_00180 [Actinobacteria bacterium 69-20]